MEGYLVSKQIEKIKYSDFFHLHNHTEYSLLDGLTKIPKMVEYVKSHQMTGVAVTDHGTLSGLIEFYKESQKQQIKPILGMEAYVATRTIEDRDRPLDKQNYHLILLAKNDQGYHNLIKLSSIANLEGFYYKPRIDHNLIRKYHQGLIVLSGCMGSEIGDALLAGDNQKAKKVALFYKNIFKDDYYFEIQDHGHPEHPTYHQDQFKINQQIFRLAKELKIKVVLTSDAHYLKKEDKIIHEILLCVQTNSLLNHKDRFSLDDFDLNLTPPQEIFKRWAKDHPEVILNTKEVASKCNVNILFSSNLIPKFELQGKLKEEDYLAELVYRGIYKKYLNQEIKTVDLKKVKKDIPDNILSRVEYELKVISEMKYAGYFLIVQDFINWGKSQGIIFGPGRGSAAGSIVSYALNITEIDPIKYNLIFERFLNPSRISMPDIDIDIQDTRRDEVIQYCINKYGKDRVANIVTFGRMAGRNAVRDVARVLEVPYPQADRLAKLIPPPVQGRHRPLSVLLNEDAQLKEEYQNNLESKKILDYAQKIEGTIRSHGVHAAGVVIAPTVLSDHVPLEMAQKGVIATQYPMGPIEELGLLKIDFLGLSNLTTIKNCLRILKKVYSLDLDLSKIPDDDPKTFQLFQNGDTTGVFQFESTGMKRYLKQLKPNRFEDIIAMNALYRPGPMLEIPNYIKGKNNPDSIVYLNDLLKPVLEDTYGVIVYQEQIIQMLQIVAGYSAGEADLIRKAIGKKDRDIMKNEYPNFIKKAQLNGLSKDSGEKLWSLIQPFADYSFNKAHATCYAMIAYYTAYLKANYPVPFMASLLSSDYDDKDRLAIEIKEALNMGIEILPPDFNESYAEFSIKKGQNTIRFSLSAIKNVGSSAAEHILLARSDQKFRSIEDFLSRTEGRIVNKKVLESLIKAGAFDQEEDREVLLNNIDQLILFANTKNKSKLNNQLTIFDLDQPILEDSRKLNLEKSTTKLNTTQQYVIWEKELLGMYLSKHPLQYNREIILKINSNLDDLDSLKDNSVLEIIGIIQSVHHILTKKNQPMAFVKIETIDNDFEAVLFPKEYQQFQKDLSLSLIFRFKLRLNKNTLKGNSLIIEDIKVFEDNTTVPESFKGPGAKSISLTKPISAQRVYVKLNDFDNDDLLISLKETIDLKDGKVKVILVNGEGSQKKAIQLPNKIEANSTQISRFEELVGSENVFIK